MNKLILFIMILTMLSCNQKETTHSINQPIDLFADIKILNYEIPGFTDLTPKQRILCYYLSEAALCGRDILYDQHYANNLLIRRTLEAIYQNYEGDTSTDNFKAFEVYLKRFWFSNGIHHHYSTDKFNPGFDRSYFDELIVNSPNAKLPIENNQVKQEFIDFITSLIFNPSIAPKRVNLDPSIGLIAGSSNNFYLNVSDKEAEIFYENLKENDDEQPIEYGLNSRLIKKNGVLTEEVYRFGEKYTLAIEKIIYWLEKAKIVAENPQQAEVIEKLMDYYRTGDLKKWDEYNIAWLADTTSRVDFINGFIEVYGDPLGRKGTWEAMVNIKDIDATKRAETLSKNAQWFEDNSPVDMRFKKKEVKGVTAKVITAVQLGGDVYPSSPIGINLPNSNWVRKSYGSKSVTISNIIHAQHKTSVKSGMLEEFCFSTEEIERAKEHGALALDLHVDMHECLGHGSGQLLPSVSADALKNYHSTLEEARADLFALYYIMDQKLIDLGLIPSFEIAKAEYDNYIRSGLITQLTRIELGKDLEESHMRNRQIIAQWILENGKNDNVIEKMIKNGKTYYVVNDYLKMRELIGQLLAEIQRIKSEGDYESGKNMVEKYGVKIDYALHKEALERFNKLNIPPYTGFINPNLVPVLKNNSIIDIKVEYNQNYIQQMLDYSTKYSFLPNLN